ncbi:MAG TPA: oligoendopeptidase F [Symbiobacteriaceae bacterium]|nr:oligoendopeptidase F [Symbiobacteriaceae bacterium]
MQRVLKRSEVKQEHTWDLEAIYANASAWEADFSKVEAMIPALSAFHGKLGESGATLLSALQQRDEIYLLFSQVAVYAHMKRDEDNSNPASQALMEKVTSLGAQIGAVASYMTPEILALPEETLNAYLQSTPGLELYKFELEDTYRQKAHVRSAEIEELLAQVSEIAGAPRNIFTMLNNADLEFPSVKDEEGNEVELTHGRYIRFLESSDRNVREGAFRALYETYTKYKNTIGATFGASVKKDVVNARARNYESARAAALAENNIPESVYDNLVATVNKNLPAFHKYLQLRKKLLGVDQLQMWDIYTPLVPEMNKQIPYEEAVETIIAALAPLGEEYGRLAREGLTTKRWVDRYENTGKTSGAYSSGTYTTHPYILMNYQGTLDSMFTLAHELGHSMHSYYSKKNQPFIYSNYTIFVAEVASTFNEALLTNHLLKSTDDKKLQMYVINHQLESIRGTLYRQTMFAEYEQKVHELAEERQPLTPDTLSEIYYDLNKRFFGTEGMVVDEAIAMEWARIPHFYRAFYVYQYSTGISAATSLAQQVLQEGQPAVERYLNFLKGGGSKYSIDLLKGAGVDMNTPAPVQQTLDLFSQLVDQMAALAE